MAIRIPTVKAGDWNGLRRILHSLSLIAAAENEDNTFKSIELPLPDGLLQMVGGTITQAPYDEVIGAYLIGGS